MVRFCRPDTPVIALALVGLTFAGDVPVDGIGEHLVERLAVLPFTSTMTAQAH